MAGGRLEGRLTWTQKAQTKSSSVAPQLANLRNGSRSRVCHRIMFAETPGRVQHFIKWVKTGGEMPRGPPLMGICGLHANGHDLGKITTV